MTQLGTGLSIPLGLFLLSTLGCSGLGETFHVEEKVEKRLADLAGKTLIVETFNGWVNVEPGADQSLQAIVTKKAGGRTDEHARSKLEAIKVLLVLEGEIVRLKVEGPSGQDGSYAGATVALLIPDRIPMTISSSNGSVTIKKASAPVTVSTSNGKIEVTATDDATLAKFDLESSNGDVRLVSPVPIDTRVQTSNGAIRYQAPLGPMPTKLITSNANVEVILPAESAFAWALETSNGSVVNEFSERKPAGRSTTSTGAIGKDPTGNLKVETSNGSIIIIKGL